MTGSMYAAVSGLKSHMNALNVIGNNVSNVNTTAYKSTRYTFNEALYTTQRSGSDGTQISGGRNPAQVGFGASIGTIDLDMSTKNYTPTGQLLDTMIDGDGFFFVGDKELGSGATAVSIKDNTALAGMNLTRLGNFNIDPNGYLVDGNGSVVWGFLEEELSATARFDQGTGQILEDTSNTNNTTGNPGNTGNTNNTTSTEEKGKALYEMTEDEISKLQKLGANIHNVRFDTLTSKKKTEIADNAKKMADALGQSATDEEKAAVEAYKKYAEYIGKQEVGSSYFVSATLTENRQMGTIRLPTKNDANELKWPEYIEPQPAKYKKNEQGNDTDELESPAEPAKFVDTGTYRLQADSVTIDEKSGALRVMTSDGSLYTIGYLAVGKVTNPNGVTHVDGRYYQAQDGAGVLRVTTVKGAVSGPKKADGSYEGPESAGDTSLVTGGLESSGTDLATEITNMITVQRGYQANTRIVTVTDSMLEELVNMKR